MLTLGPDVDVPSFAILEAQPRHGLNNCPRIPNTGDHYRFACPGIWVVKPNFKNFGTHRRDLLLDCGGGLARRLLSLEPSISRNIHATERPLLKRERRGRSGTLKSRVLVARCTAWGRTEGRRAYLCFLRRTSRDQPRAAAIRSRRSRSLATTQADNRRVAARRASLVKYGVHGFLDQPRRRARQRQYRPCDFEGKSDSELAEGRTCARSHAGGAWGRDGRA